MKNNVLNFRLKQRAGRSQALQWLACNFVSFPDIKGIGPDIFHGWRFIRASDGIVYFANCINAGIVESELTQFVRYA